MVSKKYNIKDRHSRSASGRESRFFSRNIGSPTKTFGDDEKLPVNTIKRQLVVRKGDP
jgi:hypothetical protein